MYVMSLGLGYTSMTGTQNAGKEEESKQVVTRSLYAVSYVGSSLCCMWMNREAFSCFCFRIEL